MLNDLFHTFCYTMVDLTMGIPIHLISTKGARWVWQVSKGCLLLWYNLCICWRSVLPHTRFCICLLDYDYAWHIFDVTLCIGTHAQCLDWLIDCLEFFAILNNFSVIWWRSVIIGERENPDTLCNAFGMIPLTFRKWTDKLSHTVKAVRAAFEPPPAGGERSRDIRPMS
jgi:hypothetical protein